MPMTSRALILAGLMLASVSLLPPSSVAGEMTYALTPQKVAEDTWVIEGSRDFFNRENGGNIVNTAFIRTDAGVVVIDTGPSLRYGEEMRAAIAAVTNNAPLARVIITHAHPDHFLGTQAFADTPVAATAETRQVIAATGEQLAENLYRLSGDWMRGTVSVPPTERLEPGVMEIGGHRLSVLTLTGHTDSDIAIFDETTGVLFAADLVFDQRLPTFPNAHAGHWAESLEPLSALPFTVLVPGHGPVSTGREPGLAAIAATAEYVTWFDRTMTRAARAGFDLTEVLDLPLPAPYDTWPPGREEFVRSVLQRYPDAEKAALPLVGQ